jgi:RecB family endonuclease NucS
MTIKIKEVYSLLSHKMIDGEALSLVGTEADMAAYLNEHPELIGDFKPAHLEEQTKYGFIDLYGRDSKGTPVAVEVKRYKADLNAVTQLRRYVERLKKQLGVVQVKGILVAPSITGNAKSMLEDWGFSFKQVQPPSHLAPMNKGQAKLKGFI